MLVPTLPDWKVETVGDDIAWMKFGEDGRLYAVNPEAGFFGVAPNTSHKTNPNAMDTIERNTIFTNCAKTDDGDIWWEGMTGEPPDARDRLARQRLDARTPTTPAAHPNARFTTPAGAVPVDRARVGGPGRRADRRLPLRRPPRHRGAAGPAKPSTGSTRVFMGATMSSETTAAAAGAVGQLRFDPMAMLPFCGYNMADYFAHWLKIGKREGAELPRVFYVNWFRKDADGKFLWPGFGENSRVLEWVFRRCEGEGEAVETPIGLLPAEGEINTEGLEISDEAMAELLSVDADAGQGAAAAGQGAPRQVRRQAAGRGLGAARGARRAPGERAGWAARSGPPRIASWPGGLT